MLGMWRCWIDGGVGTEHARAYHGHIHIHVHVHIRTILFLFATAAVDDVSAPILPLHVIQGKATGLTYFGRVGIMLHGLG